MSSRMKLWLSYQAGKKIESREEKGSVKIWELDSDNIDFFSDSSLLEKKTFQTLIGSVI